MREISLHYHLVDSLHSMDAHRFVKCEVAFLEGQKYPWKGLYNGQAIDFYLNDAEFKNGVFGQQLAFTSGDTITVKLEIRRKLDVNGNVIVKGYSVIEVLGYKHSASTFVETRKGAVERTKREINKTQMSLGFVSNEE